MFAQCFPVSHTGNIVCSVSFCFQDANYAYDFNENPSMRALAKILRARASELSFNFCDQFEQRPNFASTVQIGLDHSIPLNFYRNFAGTKVARKSVGKVISTVRTVKLSISLSVVFSVAEVFVQTELNSNFS